MSKFKRASIYGVGVCRECVRTEFSVLLFEDGSHAVCCNNCETIWRASWAAATGQGEGNPEGSKAVVESGHVGEDLVPEEGGLAKISAKKIH